MFTIESSHNPLLVYRRLAEDGDVRAKHRALFALAESTRVRLSLPAPEPEAVRSLQTLLREAGAQYAPVTSMLKVTS